MPKQLTEFQVFPKHIGTWSGYWIRMDANAQEIERFEAEITQKIVDNQWLQTNTYHYADGRIVTNSFVGKVISNDEIEIEAVDVPAWKNFTTIAREHGDRIIIFNVWDKATGQLFATEMINLINNDNKCRNVQSFTEDGKLKSLMLIVEKRIST
ncbi:DUF3598 family protein [Nostoc sp. FACHB-973]|nr:DUF3598 family protein [Nostoc sp. FACHB-973]MBX9259321.1 DUF3598 family protein [Desmonostoc muscorum CCALA 125]